MLPASKEDAISNLHIKNVPDDLHRRLRARAEASQMTMRDYVLRLIHVDLALPTLDSWLDAVLSGPAWGGDEPSGEEIRDTVGSGWDAQTDEVVLAADGDVGDGYVA